MCLLVCSYRGHRVWLAENARAPGDQVTTLLAMSYYGLGQFKEAAERLKPIAAAQPDNAELSYLLANCYLWSGQYKAALWTSSGDYWAMILNSAAVHMLLGEAMDAYYRTDDAIVEFEAAKQAPKQPDVTSVWAICSEAKRYADAEREFPRRAEE